MATDWNFVDAGTVEYMVRRYPTRVVLGTPMLVPTSPTSVWSDGGNGTETCVVIVLGGDPANVRVTFDSPGNVTVTDVMLPAILKRTISEGAGWELTLQSLEAGSVELELIQQLPYL